MTYLNSFSRCATRMVPAAVVCSLVAALGLLAPDPWATLSRAAMAEGRSGGDGDPSQPILEPPLVPGPPPAVAPPAIWDEFWFLNECAALGECGTLYTSSCSDPFTTSGTLRPCEYCDYPYALVAECHFSFNIGMECSEIADAFPDCGRHWTGLCRPNGTCDSAWDGNRCLRSFCVEF